MRYALTRLGGPINFQINDGPITRFTTGPDTLVLSVDGEEVDRKTIEPGDRYSIAVSNGKAWIMVMRHE